MQEAKYQQAYGSIREWCFVSGALSYFARPTDSHRRDSTRRNPDVPSSSYCAARPKYPWTHHVCASERMGFGYLWPFLDVITLLASVHTCTARNLF
jgi:hypothetical protein